MGRAGGEGEACVNCLINRRQNGVPQRTQVAILGIPNATTNIDIHTYIPTIYERYSSQAQM